MRETRTSSGEWNSSKPQSPPVRSTKLAVPKTPFWELRQGRRWGSSRNKVSVLEGADGSPPFKEYSARQKFALQIFGRGKTPEHR